MEDDTTCPMSPDEFEDIVLSGKSFKKGPITVDGNVYLYKCTSLTTLPDNLTVNGAMSLRVCTSLTTLPDNLTVYGGLNLFNCTSLRALPHNLTVKGWLDLYKCTSLQFNGSLGDIKGRVYMTVEQMKQIPLEYIPLYIGYTYSDPKILDCLKQRLKKGK